MIGKITVSKKIAYVNLIQHQIKVQDLPHLIKLLRDYKSRNWKIN